MAESDGYADADSYLAATVGAGCNLDTYQKFVETVKLAESYRNAYRTGLTFDQSEIQAAYEASPERLIWRPSVPFITRAPARSKPKKPPRR
mgnify:CR=1 FL=1